MIVVYEKRGVTKWWLWKTVFLESSICFFPESLDSSHLWGIWNRIVKMLEVGAKSLAIISLLFRKQNELEMEIRWVAGARTGSECAQRRFLAATFGWGSRSISSCVLLCLSKREVRAVLYGPFRCNSWKTFWDPHGRTSQYKVFLSRKLLYINQPQIFQKKIHFPLDIHWFKYFSMLNFCI